MSAGGGAGTSVVEQAPVAGQRARTEPASATPPWLIVAGRESRDVWGGGRGPLLVFAFSVLLSVTTYLVATNKVLNYLEQREAVGLTLQVAVAVGALVALLVSADAISGERERGTLETLLLTPAPRQHIVAGKLIAALSLWLAALCVSVPYIWVLGHGISLVGQALLLGLVVGTLLAVSLAALGMVVSGLSSSNKVSLAVSLFLLLALFAPTQFPSSAQKGWLGNAFIRVNPLASGEHYISAVVVSGRGWTRDLSYLVSPMVAAIVGTVVLIVAADRLMRLRQGGSD